MNEFTYIYDGQTHTNLDPEYMTALGIDEETQEGIINQRDFELSQNVEKRAAAYKIESDPLFLEAVRKSYEGDEEGAEVARTLGLQAVARIQTRYPIN